MSETTIEPTPAQEPEKPDTPEVDWKAKSREWEKRAKDNKAAADKLAELEEAQKSAEQKAAEQLAVAQRKASDAETRLIRYEIALDKGIAKADADLFMLGADVETITAQADALLKLAGNTRRNGSHVPTEGKTPTQSGGDADMREFTRQLFEKAE